jgi:UDP-N-acetylmuramate-alanine ligase
MTLVTSGPSRKAFRTSFDPQPGPGTSHRPKLLAKLLNAAYRSVAVGGTNGKSTVTGMVGWISTRCTASPP